MDITDLRRVFFLTSNYIDFLSVVDGLRDVGLVKLSEDRITTVTGVPIAFHVMPLAAQKRILRRFLTLHRPGYVLYGSGSSVFVCRKEKLGAVRTFLQMPRSDRNYHEEFGALLGYPSCCTAAFLKAKPAKRKSFSPLPFVPCSEQCRKRWISHYERIMRKYKLESMDFNVWVKE